MAHYCVKCKVETPTIKPVISKTKNGRNMMKGTCSRCGCTKCQFMKASATRTPHPTKKKSSGGNIFSDIFR